jgi:hypothetical protein
LVPQRAQVRRRGSELGSTGAGIIETLWGDISRKINHSAVTALRRWDLPAARSLEHFLP